MKKTILLFLFVVVGICVNAQADLMGVKPSVNNNAYAFTKNTISSRPSDTLVWKAKNAIFFEAFGAGGMPWGYTLNYDRLLHAKGIYRTSVRVGIDPYLLSGFYAFPIMLNLLIGRKVCFEVGAGGDIIIDSSNGQTNTGGAFTSVIGVRYQDINQRLFYRAGLTPTLGRIEGRYFVSLAGASVGYSF